MNRRTVDLCNEKGRELTLKVKTPSKDIRQSTCLLHVRCDQSAISPVLTRLWTVGFGYPKNNQNQKIIFIFLSSNLRQQFTRLTPNSTHALIQATYQMTTWVGVMTTLVGVWVSGVDKVPFGSSSSNQPGRAIIPA